jgi:hypothetical protein
MKNILFLLLSTFLVNLAIADDSSSHDAGIVNNSNLNRKMASNKQFPQKKGTTAVVIEEQTKNNATVNLKSASNKLF